MAIDINGAFDQLRELKNAVAVQTTHQAVTLPGAVDAALAKYPTELGDSQRNPVTQDMVTQNQANREQTGFTDAVLTVARDTIRLAVFNDQPQLTRTTDIAEAEFIRQMRVAGDTIEQSIVSASVTQPSADGAQLVIGLTTDGGWLNEHALAEDMTAVVVNGGLKIESEPRAGGTSSADYPDGSRISRTLSLTGYASSSLQNPSFDDPVEQADIPAEWDVQVATPGVTIRLSTPETQTVIISGSPTSGTYTLRYTDQLGQVQYTTPIAFNAPGTDVAAALSALDGLISVSVVTTGTSPDYTHTVTFDRAEPGGDLPSLSSTDGFDTGAIAHAEVTPGEPGHSGRSLVLIGNAAELTAIRQRVTVTERTAYLLAVHAQRSAGATGVVKIRLIDGAGTTLQNAAGKDISIDVDLSTISSAGFDIVSAIFHSPRAIPEIAYFEIAAVSPISAGGILYLDDLILTEAIQLYDRGPYAAWIAHLTPPLSGDSYEAIIANDYAGELQLFWSRAFQSRVLPSAPSGAQTIND